MSKPERYIVVSYVPLLKPTKRILRAPSDQYTPEFATELAEELGGTLENTPHVPVRACLWLQDNTSEKPDFHPVFLIDNADEVLDHLKYWCENDPTTWFHLYLEKIDDDRYIAMLFPNLNKSIERFKLACLVFTDVVPQSEADYTLVFRPLEFLSQSATMFDNIKEHLGEELKIGFLNTGDFDQNAPEACLDKVQYIGPLSRVREDNAKDKNNYILPYVEGRLKDIANDE